MKKMQGSRLMSDFNFTSKYAKYCRDKSRRELWHETIDRMRNMHLEKYSDKNIDDIINKAFDNVSDKNILASQRAMQFAGKPILNKNMRIYNCSATHVDRIRAFSELFYLMLCGTGAGISVQTQHINKLPKLIDISEMPNVNNTVSYIIEDTIESWSEAVNVLIESFIPNNTYTGKQIEFNYSLIRPKGSPLSIGGKAPGPDGLRKTLEKITDVLKKCVFRDSTLRSVDCFDIACHISDAVLSGGIRRAAIITMFTPDDELMLHAKTGNWFIENPHRARSNNSMMIVRDTMSEERFMGIIETIKQFGEPGFIFTEHEDYAVNPCAEVSMCPIAIYKPDASKSLKLPEKYKHYLESSDGFSSPLVEKYTKELLNNKEKFSKYGFKYVSGWQVCNLTEINCKSIKDLDDFVDKARNSSIIGTLQAGYTDVGYLTEASKHIIERESLIGVSLTGMQDNHDIVFNAHNQQKIADIVNNTNMEISKIIGINSAARTTVVKPSGNAAILLECSSGIHANHSNRFFRRVQVNKDDNVLAHFRKVNPHAITQSVWSKNKTDDVITFPIEVKGKTKTDKDAITFLNEVLMTQQNWIKYGTARPDSCEGLLHNVSNTVNVDSHEWEEAGKFIFNNQQYFTGISLLPTAGDKIYQQAPMEACYFENELIDKYGETVISHAKEIYKTIFRRLPGNTIQDIRFYFETLERLWNNQQRKYMWIEQCIKPLNEDNIPETNWEFESRAEADYIATIAIYKNIRNKLYKGCINNIEIALDMLASIKDEERWFNLTKNFKEVDYSTLVEDDDETKAAEVVACAGGTCEL